MTDTIYNQMFSDVGTSFSGAVNELEYTLQSPTRKSKTDTVVRGFYQNDKMFRNSMELASKYFNGITLSSKFVKRDCPGKIYLELEVEHIYPEIKRFRETLKEIISGITISSDPKNQKIISMLKDPAGPDLRTFGIDINASFLFGDLYDQDTNTAQIEYSTIEEENGLQFFGLAGFEEHKLQFVRKYVLCLTLDMSTNALSCAMVSKEKKPDGTPVEIYSSKQQTAQFLTQYTAGKDGDVVFQLSTGYLHYELLSFLNSSPSKYKTVVEQYAKYFSQAGTTVKIYSKEEDQQYKPSDTMSISDCPHAGDISVTFRVPNFLVSGKKSEATIKDVIEKSVKFSADTGNAITEKRKDLITKEAKQIITGRLDYALRPEDRFFISVDDGKSWTEIKESAFIGRQFTSPELTLSLADSRIMFKYIDQYTNTIQCKTSVKYTYQPNGLDHTLSVVSIINAAGGFNTNTKTQTIKANFSRTFDKDSLVEGSIDNGKTWSKIPPESISLDRKSLTWSNVVLSEGVNNICFRTVDVAGNFGAKTGIKQVFLKTSLPKNIVKFEPLMYRYGAKITKNVGNNVEEFPYEYSDWYENFWAAYKSTTEEEFYNPNTIFGSVGNNGGNPVVVDRSAHSYYPTPTTIWDLPEPERVKTFVNTATGFKSKPYETNYQHQNMVVVLEYSLQQNEKIFGSVDNGKTWVELTEHVYPYSELSSAIQKYRTIKDENLVSTTLGYKSRVGFAPYSGDVKQYAEETGKQFTSGGVYSSVGGNISPVKQYSADGYVSSGYCFIGGDESEIMLSGVRSGRARSDLGEPVYKEIAPVEKGQAVVIWNKFDLVPGKNNILIKVVDFVGNQSVIGTQQYVYKPSLAPIAVKEITATGMVSREENVLYFNNPIYDVRNGSAQTHEAVLTLTRDLEESEFVEVWRPALGTKYAKGTANAFLKTAKIAPNKILISPFFVGNRSGETNANADGSNTPSIDYSNWINIYVGDDCGNVSGIASYNVRAKTSVNATVSFTSISEDTDIPDDFVTAVSNQDVSFTVKNASNTDKIYFALNNSSWANITPSSANSSGVRTAIVKGVVLSLGENSLKVKIVDSLGNETTYTRSCTLLKEDPRKIVVKSDIGQGDNTLRYFISNTIDIPFSYYGPVLATNDRFMGSVDNGNTWVDLVPVQSNEFQEYNYVWKAATLQNGTSANHVIKIKLLVASKKIEYVSVNSIAFPDGNFYYASNAMSTFSIQNVSSGDIDNRQFLGNTKSTITVNQPSKVIDIRSATQTSVEVRLFKGAGSNPFEIKNWRVKGNKSTVSGTVDFSSSPSAPFTIPLTFSGGAIGLAASCFADEIVVFSGTVAHPKTGNKINVCFGFDKQDLATTGIDLNQYGFCKFVSGYVGQPSTEVIPSSKKFFKLYGTSEYIRFAAVVFLVDWYEELVVSILDPNAQIGPIDLGGLENLNFTS